MANRTSSRFDDPFEDAVSAKSNKDRQNATFTTQSIDSRRGDAGGRNIQPQGSVNVGDYGTSDLIGYSDEWYGRGNDVNQLGIQSAAYDSPSFWNLYGSDVKGWQPGGAAQGFMGNVFDTRAMGNAMYQGSNFDSPEEYMAGQTSLANALTGGPGTGPAFVDPGVLVQQVLTGLSGNDVAGAGLNPMMRGLIASAQGDPLGSVASLVNFFGDALKGAMPPDVLQAFTNTLARLGQVWTNEVSHGDIGKLDTSNFAQWLMQKMGPRLGL